MIEQHGIALKSFGTGVPYVANSLYKDYIWHRYCCERCSWEVSLPGAAACNASAELDRFRASSIAAAFWHDDHCRVLPE